MRLKKPASHPLTEKQLISEVVQGNQEAFTCVFYDYHQKLGAFVLRLSESSELTREIVQDVFLKIWTNRAALTDIEHFEAYLFTMARNQTFNALKKLARERLKKQEWLKINADTLLVAERSENWTEQHFQLLEEAIGKLPPQQRKVYLLRSKTGLKYEEIAVRLDLSFETVKKHMQLAMRSIRHYVTIHKDVIVSLLLFIFLF